MPTSREFPRLDPFRQVVYRAPPRAAHFHGARSGRRNPRTRHPAVHAQNDPEKTNSGSHRSRKTTTDQSTPRTKSVIPSTTEGEEVNNHRNPPPSPCQGEGGGSRPDRSIDVASKLAPTTNNPPVRRSELAREPAIPARRAAKHSAAKRHHRLFHPLSAPLSARSTGHPGRRRRPGPAEGAFLLVPFSLCAQRK